MMAREKAYEERETSLYLTQIQHLHEELERYQLESDRLHKQNKELVSKHKALEEEKKDITEYLKHCEVAKEKEAMELTEWLQVVERDTETMKLQHSLQIQELQRQVDELNAVRMTKEAQCEELREQLREQLVQQMQESSEVESMEKQLVSQKKEHEAAIQKLKDERNAKFGDINNRCVEEIYRRVTGIVEEERTQHNEVIEQYEFLLKEAADLWITKMNLKEGEKDLLKEISGLQKTLKIRRTGIHRYEVKQLKKICHDMKMKMKNYNITKEDLLAEEKGLRQDLVSASRELHQKATELDQLKAERKKKRSESSQLEGVMQEAVVILRHILMDSEASDTQWKMESLLKILESAIHQPADSSLDVSTEKSSQEQKLQATDSKPGSAETLNLAADPLFLLSHFLPGDFGIIPQPRWKIKRAFTNRTLLHLNSQRTSSSVVASSLAPESDPSVQLPNRPIQRQKLPPLQIAKAKI